MNSFFYKVGVILLVNQRPSQSKRPFHLDKVLIGLLLLMAVLSLIAIYGAIPLTASNINGQELFIKQILFYLSGFALLSGLLIFGIDRLFTGIRVFYWILMILLVLLLVDKVINLPLIWPVNGTRAWIFLPGISLQPSEFMKIVLIIMTANIVDEHNRSLTQVTYGSDIRLFLKVLKIALPPLFLIFLQPDTGIPVIIVISLIAILAVSGIKKQWIWLGVLALFLGFGGVIFLFETNPDLLASILGAPYKLNRFYGWLETEKYILTWGNQLYTALLAVGSSGWTGHGLQSSLIRFAEPQNDFIFAVVAKNHGFLGTASVLLASLILDLKLLHIAYKYDQPRERYLVAGLLGILLYQQFQNMGMIVGILPITGVTLPFISYGGSSLWSFMIPLAIILHMSSENHSRTLH